MGEKVASRMRGAIQLSRRQQQVIELLAAGFKNQEIAKELGIGIQAVKNCVRKIYAVTGARNRVQLALWYRARWAEVTEGLVRYRQSE